MKAKPLATVAAGASLLLWPALLNGYPFLFPDSIMYLKSASLELSAFQHPSSHHIPDLRAEIYALWLGLLHWNRSPWPIVIFAAVATSYVLWLVAQSMLPQKWAGCYFLGIVAFLAATTVAGWFVSAVLADAMAPVAYLSLSLLFLFWSSLSKAERWLVACLAWLGIVAHATHLLVAAVLCLLLVIPMARKWERLPVSKFGWATAVGILMIAVIGQIAIHRFLYGKATLNGSPPPYLMARVIADGPGRTYLERHCGEHNWEICRHVDSLPATDDEFLWKVGGIYNSATEEQRQRLSAEQMALVAATVEVYPRAQIHASLRNFWNQLTSIGLADFAWPNAYVPLALDGVMPGAKERYLATRQANKRLPIPAMETVQKVVVGVSLALIVVLLPLAWLRRSAIVGFAAVVGTAVSVNAAVCGVISGVYPRYEARVMWMVVLVTMMLLVDVLQKQPRSGTAEGAVGGWKRWKLMQRGVRHDGRLRKSGDTHSWVARGGTASFNSSR